MEYKVYCMNGECDQYIIMDAYEYGYYQDDFMCHECYDADEMAFYQLTGWDDSDALASAGFGSDEDYM